MSIPLLTTKICVPPPRPNLVPRPRLIGRLDEGVRLGHRLALVSAPAGSGKTTLVTAWLHGTPGVAWLSLDKEDDQPIRFLTYLVAALQQVDGNIGQGVQSLLTGSGRLPIEMLVTTLINDVATAFESPLSSGEDLALEGGAACSGQGGAGRRLVLVLDDYQVIDAPDIHGAVAFLLDHLPQGMHLVIVTREDPPLPLSRWRARGLMTEIRERDLRFSEPEVTAFLTGVMGLDLAPDEVSALNAHTEGWVAGLQLAAISMRGHSDPGGFVRSFTGSHRHILDYLTDEVLRQQSKEVRSFLFQTCILSRLSGPLCDAVTGREDGQGVLEHLEHANLFVISLDDQRQWYRYHHLFGELLQYHLKQREGTEVLMRLHRRAGEWLARHGFEAEALQHAIAGQDFDRAAELIESVAVDTIVGGGATSLQRWIDALPEDVVRGRSLLCVIHAWTLNLTEQVEAIEPRLQDAERALEVEGLAGDAAVVSDLRGQIAAIRASNARRQGDWPLSIRYLEEALALLAQDDLVVRTTINLNLGRAYMFTGRLGAAADAFGTAQRLGQASGNLLTSLNATGFLGAVLIAQGKLQEAAALCRETIGGLSLGPTRIREGGGAVLPTLGHVRASLARVLYEWNDLEGAARLLEESIGPAAGDQAHYCYRSTVRLRASLLAWVEETRGVSGGAAALSQGLDALARQEQQDLGDVDLTAWRVRLWLAHGNLAAAAAWAEAYQAGDLHSRIWRPYGDLALARVLIAEQRLEEALARLAQVRQSAREGGGSGWVIKAHILEALALHAMGRADDAVTALTEALLLAEPQGYVRSFVDEGEAMAALLVQAGRCGVVPQYVDRLLNAFGTGEPEGELEETTGPTGLAAFFIEALTEREREVLCLIDAGLSNREIADKLCISLNTVRTHTKGLYGKLNVHSRTQAVNRARELGLL